MLSTRGQKVSIFTNINYREYHPCNTKKYIQLTGRRVKMKIVIKNTESVRKDILKQGMNMRQFAEKINVTQHYWSNIMNGKRYPSAAVAKRIADELGKPIQEVFDFE